MKRQIVFIGFLMGLLLQFSVIADEKENSSARPEIKDIKAYCIDFNWGLGRRSGFAKAGTWKDADPAEHVKWYKNVGANVIQTFAVSCNGYAWYKNGFVPEQPGLKHDFLTEVVKRGHAEGMKVMGYFCIAANTRWGKENPELSYGSPSTYHIPYTDEYLAFLSKSISDAVKKTGIDGFMIDWVWMPKRKSTGGKWIEAEKKLYKQLMGEEFPGEDKITKAQELAYGQKAIDRCWKTIRKAAKDANPDCIVWLTSNSVNSPLVKNSNMYKEVDWFMGESGKLEEIIKIKPMVGQHTRLITCMSGFGGNDASKDVPEAMAAGVGVYGYAKPSNNRGTIDLDRIFPMQMSQLVGNNKRIAVMARAYRGKSIDTVWKDGDFVEPEKPLPFRVSLKGRRGFSDTARTTFEDEKTIITINTPYQSGRSVLTRVAKKWPSTIVVRLKRYKTRPGPTDLRVANGKIGVSIVQKDGIKVVAGEWIDKLELNKSWQGEHFLKGGKPESPIKVDGIQASTTDKIVEFVIPEIITESNPPSIAFEWGIDGRVR